MKTTKILTLVFCLTAAVRFIFPVYRNLDKFTEKYNPALYERKYNASQYMIPQSKNPISDEELLSHAGYKYMRGLNPILINSDHPPLGKYIIGVFTLLTGNNRTVSLFFAALNITLLSLILYILTRRALYVSMGILALSFDPMFIDQVIHSPILDIIQVSFLLLYILLFILWQQAKRNTYIIFMALSLGCLSSVKLYFPALIVIAVTTLSLLLMKKSFRSITGYLLITFPVAFFTYAATYFRYFIEAKAFLPFFGVQKWIFLFWQNNSVNKTNTFGGVIPFVLLNKWKVWWGTQPYISYSGWTAIWPVFFILGLIAGGYFILSYIKGSLKKRKNPEIVVFLTLWLLLFTLYLCFIPISPRYLMMLYFPVYLLVILFIYYKFNPMTHHVKKIK